MRIQNRHDALRDFFVDEAWPSVALFADARGFLRSAAILRRLLEIFRGATISFGFESIPVMLANFPAASPIVRATDVKMEDDDFRLIAMASSRSSQQKRSPGDLPGLQFPTLTTRKHDAACPDSHLPDRRFVPDRPSSDRAVGPSGRSAGRPDGSAVPAVLIAVRIDRPAACLSFRLT